MGPPPFPPPPTLANFGTPAEHPAAPGAPGIVGRARRGQDLQVYLPRPSSGPRSPNSSPPQPMGAIKCCQSFCCCCAKFFLLAPWAVGGRNQAAKDSPIAYGPGPLAGHRPTTCFVYLAPRLPFGCRSRFCAGPFLQWRKAVPGPQRGGALPNTQTDFGFFLNAVCALPKGRGGGVAQTSSGVVHFALVLCVLRSRWLSP